jgi:hypothetical protein
MEPRGGEKTPSLRLNLREMPVDRLERLLHYLDIPWRLSN